MSKQTIMFADNDSHFLAVRSEFLLRAGYRVLQVSDPDLAVRILSNEKIDLAILDNRLLNDADEDDDTGIQIARQYSGTIPTIVLTGYPTWEAVRSAMGPSIDDLPPAVDFVSKHEGPEILLQAVDWALRRTSLRINLMQTLKVPTLTAVTERLYELGPKESSLRLQESVELTRRQLNDMRAFDNQRANQYHQWGLIMSIIGMVLILTGIAFFLSGNVLPGAFPSAVGVISHTIGTLFFHREDVAHKRTNETMRQLEDVDRLGNLFSLIESLKDEAGREQYKKELLNRILEKWFNSVQDSR